MSRTVSSLNLPSDLRRHALVWLKQAPQPDLEADFAEVERWHRRGKPWVACRHRGKPDHVSLGFCLTSAEFPARRPHRISVETLHELVLRIERPPSLVVIAASDATEAMRNDLSRFSTAASDEGLNIHVFGSWMWQVLTGQTHVNAASDLDVLIDVTTKAEADQAATFLKRHETGYPFKIDGELSLPNLGEVHWKEYLSDSPEILLKSITMVRLISREALWT